MKNVLLPTDFSENSWNAIKYALNIFENTDCTFYLFHTSTLSYKLAMESPYINTGEFVDNTFDKSNKRELATMLKRISNEFSPNKKHHFFTLTDYDFLVDSLRRQVEEKKIDMIVMGTKGASGIKKLIIGSNAADVIKKVKCTTLIVPEKATYNQLDEIAFPTDYYLTYGVDMLNPLLEFMEKSQSNLSFLYITNKKEALNRSQEENKSFLQDYFNNFELSFHNLINKKMEDAIEGFVKSRDVKMIAMGAKNLNYFQHILFQSRVEEMSYYIDIPFLVMHE